MLYIQEKSTFKEVKKMEIFNNFEISLVVFMPNITTNHAITYTNFNPLRNSYGYK